MAPICAMQIFLESAYEEPVCVKQCWSMPTSAVLTSVIATCEEPIWKMQTSSGRHSIRQRRLAPSFTGRSSRRVQTPQITHGLHMKKRPRHVDLTPGASRHHFRHPLQCARDCDGQTCMLGTSKKMPRSLAEAYRMHLWRGRPSARRRGRNHVQV